MKTKLRDAVELELCREAKVSDLLGDAANERFEASGVVAVDERLLRHLRQHARRSRAFGGGLLPGTSTIA